MQKMLRTTYNLFNCRKNQIQAVRKQFLFLCEALASKLWCYIQATVTCKNRHRVVRSLAHGCKQDFSKIVMIKEINHLTFGMAVSGKYVDQRKIFFNTNSACLAQAMDICKKRDHVICNSTHGGK